MSTLATPIDSTLPVNEIIRLYPGALAVLTEHGIDTCCGGSDSLAVAAAAARVELNNLIPRILASPATSQAPTNACSCGCDSIGING